MSLNAIPILFVCSRAALYAVFLTESLNSLIPKCLYRPDFIVHSDLCVFSTRQNSISLLEEMLFTECIFFCDYDGYKDFL